MAITLFVPSISNVSKMRIHCYVLDEGVCVTVIVHIIYYRTDRGKFVLFSYSKIKFEKVYILISALFRYILGLLLIFSLWNHEIHICLSVYLEGRSA